MDIPDVGLSADRAVLPAIARLLLCFISVYEAIPYVVRSTIGLLIDSYASC